MYHEGYFVKRLKIKLLCTYICIYKVGTGGRC